MKSVRDWVRDMVTIQVARQEVHVWGQARAQAQAVSDQVDKDQVWEDQVCDQVDES